MLIVCEAAEGQLSAVSGGTLHMEPVPRVSLGFRDQVRIAPVELQLLEDRVPDQGDAKIDLVYSL